MAEKGRNCPKIGTFKEYKMCSEIVFNVWKISLTLPNIVLYMGLSVDAHHLKISVNLLLLPTYGYLFWNRMSPFYNMISP